MRVPYTVGRWVREQNHYGRERLIQYLVGSNDPAIWVIGARRMGKTSLLRQLEALTTRQAGDLVPLFWDMQGCENSGDLSFELYMALEDARARFERHGVAIESYEGQDAPLILRRLGQHLASGPGPARRLCLLIDEAEVLIQVGRQEPTWLERLRATLLDGHSRTILASTKLLAQLNQVTAGWQGGPFLAGFTMLRLWRLDEEAAVALIEQRQSGQPIVVAPTVRDAILEATNQHPYLIQYLCQRLYGEQPAGVPTLRMPQPVDLAPDQLLGSLLAVDLQHMTALERRLVMDVAAGEGVSEQELAAAMPEVPRTRLRLFLWGLARLGHLHVTHGRWYIGSAYLRHWLTQAQAQGQPLESPALDDASYEPLLRLSQAHEVAAFAAGIRDLEARYALLVAGREQATAAATAAQLAFAREELQTAMEMIGGAG